MVKPMGVVAMLTMLTAGPALASEFVNTRQVKTWGLTSQGDLYMKTIRGKVYNAALSCNDLSDINSDQSIVFSSNDVKLKPGSKLIVKTTEPKQKYTCMIKDVKS